MTSSVNFTSRLLNYVEPYYVDGVAKSAFYSEVNTNLKRNDKVFILNGFHDSEVFISKGKYAKNADGYKVLFVDRCKIVLDIDYKGVTQSYIESDFDNFIKVYHIRSQREFDYINKIYVDTYTFSSVSKFEFGYTNNIIYSDDVWSGYSGGIGSNTGLTTNRNFWAKSGTSWINVTNQFNTNSFTFSGDYYARGLTNNGRIYIVGEDITYDKTYKQRNVYKFIDPSTPNSWKIDIEYKQPIITKLNFRKGIFRGTHNDGVFGSYIKEESWYGTQSKWNSGFFVNSIWNSGSINSKSDNTAASYYAILDAGKPVQSTDFSNNKGYGYNYFLDSNVLKGEVRNGNFINCNIGYTSSGLTAVDGYVLSVNNSFPLKTLGGLYNFCDINDAELNNSTTLDSIIDNCSIVDTRMINSQLSESYSSGGEFSNDNGISVISADIMSYIPSYIGNSTTSSSNIRGVLKLYISDTDYKRLDSFDNFYITKINKDYVLSTITSDQKILLPYETRYVLDTFLDFKISGSNQDCLATIKTKFENKSKAEVKLISGSYFNNSIDNTNNLASVDIDLGQYLAYYFDQSSFNYTYLNNQMVISTANVQNLFLNTSITNADFRNGVIKNVRWNSGSNVNYPSNIIKIDSGKLKISRAGSDQIDVYLNEYRPTIEDGQLKVGTYVWLDSIHFVDGYSTDIDISGVYKIVNLLSNVIQNETRITLSSNIINTLPLIGFFAVPDNLPTYVSINKLLIDSSEIQSGLFSRTLFRNSNFSNVEFDNLDRNLNSSNIDKLRLNNIILRDNSNTIRNGLVYKSHISNVNWIGGISNNSIWKGATFGNGVFTNGFWENGTFQNGYFQNSKETILSTVDYSGYQHYKNWTYGNFNDGIFYNSVWVYGIFNNGKFYNSDWYGGTWNNGILGDKNVPTLNTNMSRFLNLGIGSTQTFWYGGIVENAQIGGDGVVYWYGGKFNNGVFTSYGSIASRESIWYDGEFNGGEFSSLARWKNGTFNKGKFRSYFGWTISSTYSTDYSWENGKFNGGQFGDASYGTNSTWFYGEFNGGIFQGRTWNDGIFQNGSFNGGGTYNVLQDESLFTESFTNSYYGLWKNGWVTNLKHNAITNELISDNNLRSDQSDPKKTVSLNNILWVDGVFDHPQGEIKNSAWLSGRFKKGAFNRSVFNPYVKRSWWDISYGTYSAFNFSQFDCTWENGDFDGGNFYISDWRGGNFMSGTMSGARWMDGIWNYGYAKNIYWENGLWKNGMWNGSPFDYTNLDNYRNVVKSKENDIILRISNITNSANLHIINAFTGSYDSEILAVTTPVSFDPPGWTFSDDSFSATNWVPSSDGLLLSSGYYSNPQMSKYAYPYTYYYLYTVTVEPGIMSGDTYKISIAFPYNLGSISIVADSSDTIYTISQKLSDKLNLGRTQPVVENFSSYVRWSNIGGDSTYPYSTYLSNTIYVYVKYSFPNYPWQLNVYTSPVLVGSYTASEVLYALTTDINPPGYTTSIFTSQADHSISLTVTSTNGRTDFAVFVGNDVYYKTLSNATTTYNFNYTPNGSNNYFAIKRILYTSPQNSSFILNSASIKKAKAVYDNNYNNKLYMFSTQSSFSYGLTGTTVSLPPNLVTNIVSDSGLISVNFGNGAFKSGIWENGYWNNGWRGYWESSDSVIMFTDIIQGSVLEISPKTWEFKMTAFSTTQGLNIGDKVSVGNIVCKDVNEDRKLIKDYLRIVDKDLNTITVQVSINASIREILKDSELHMIYVSKNIWLNGVFHNGYFEGVWNYGLFKGYPYITVMNNSQWIGGVFDGGRFIGTQSKYVSVGTTYSYNTALIQNFIFRDNNTSNYTYNYLYNSWIDVTYTTYSMTNIFRDNITYNLTYNTSIADGNLRGYPTYDVLSSDSTFRNSYDSNFKSYKLGSKFRIYTDFIGDGSKFNYPLNTSGLPGVESFLDRGWTYTNDSSAYSSNTSALNENTLLLNYTGDPSGTKKDILDNIYTRDIEKFRYSIIDFNIIYNDPSITTTSTTTTTTTTSGGYSVYYSTVIGLYPLNGGYSNAAINLTNNGGSTIYVYVIFNSGGNSSGSVSGDYGSFPGSVNYFISGTITNYGQTITSASPSPGYYTLGPSTTISVSIFKADGYTNGSSVRLAYSTSPGGPLTII